MSNAAVPPSPFVRATLPDLFLLVMGFGLSQLLIQFETLTVTPGPRATNDLGRFLVPALPRMLRIGEGVILLWPLFFIPQRLRGRKQPLTYAEWLWIFAWLGTVSITALAVTQKFVNLPEFLTSSTSWVFVIWYCVLGPSMALVALVFLLLGLVRRRPQPWTHHMALVLMLWPLAPLAAVLTLGQHG
jgi:hypothetical protein